MPPKKSDATPTTTPPANAESAAIDTAAADQCAVDTAAVDQATTDTAADEHQKSAQELFAPTQEQIDAALANRPIGTIDQPTAAVPHDVLAKFGIEVLSEAERGENLICRVLQDAKRVWKEYFHAA